MRVDLGGRTGLHRAMQDESRDPPGAEARPSPRLGARALAEKQAREARAAAALRANLRRRKEQARARQNPAPPEPGPAGALLTRTLLERVMSGYGLDLGGIHGPGHWRRVRANGLALAAGTAGADAVVIELFALLHDSRRVDDDEDPGHGARAAALVGELAAAGLLALEAERLALLAAACAGHAAGTVSADPTIGCCWDADRLDLSRLGMRPRASLLSTAAALDAALQQAAWTSGYEDALVAAGPGWPAPPR